MRAWAAFDRFVLQNLWLSRFGNAAVLATLVGAVVDRVAGLPTGWAIAIAASIFFASLRPLRMLAERVSAGRMGKASNANLISEATEQASGVATVLADAKRDEPDRWDPQEDPSADSHQAWAKRVNESRRVENKTLARYMERHQAEVFALANELGARSALTDEEVQSVIHAGSTIHWLDRVPGLLLLGARRLRDKG